MENNCEGRNVPPLQQRPLRNRQVGSHMANQTGNHETHTSSVHSETQSIFPRSLPNIQSRNCRPSLQSNQLTDNDEPEKKRDRRSENGDNVGEESSGSINDSFAVQANRNAGINANVTASDELPPTSIQVAPFSVLSPCATASLQAFTLEKEPVQNLVPERRLSFLADTDASCSENTPIPDLSLSQNRTWVERDPARESARLASFHSYRHSNHFPSDTKCALALFGFYYSEKDDKILCFSCDRVIPKRDWTDEDNPQDVALHFACCPLIQGKEIRNQPIGETLIEGNFEKESARLASFQHYRHKDYFSNDIICALALHGFYYSETYDAVLCFSCHRYLRDWAGEDNPRNTTLHSPRCPLVLGIEARNNPIGGGRISFKYCETFVCDSSCEPASLFQRSDFMDAVEANNTEPIQVQGIAENENSASPSSLVAHQDDGNVQKYVLHSVKSSTLHEETADDFRQEIFSSDQEEMFHLDDITPPPRILSRRRSREMIDEEASSVVLSRESEFLSETSSLCEESIHSLSDPSSTNSIKSSTQQESTENQPQASQLEDFNLE